MNSIQLESKGKKRTYAYFFFPFLSFFFLFFFFTGHGVCTVRCAQKRASVIHARAGRGKKRSGRSTRVSLVNPRTRTRGTQPRIRDRNGEIIAARTLPIAYVYTILRITPLAFCRSPAERCRCLTKNFSINSWKSTLLRP